ncbi:LLM class F420-dependent oxidoreductase [uncultured Agrobacterium sp.]|nr:LLM class F420-dependent oxidoreductase [uncultured Agrobacterium sp.]KTR82885.1 5,10-methylene tetrahydromethanopterin reductase [Novosphingobium barchaimii]
MKLGIGIGYAGAKMDVPIERIRRAEALGFDSVWTAETYSSDAMTPLAYIGALTDRIRLGTGIAQLAARTPANMAMAAQTIDAMCGEGRMIVGLGMSGPQIVEGWYGQPWGKPNTRMRDYVAIMKQIWKREGPVSHSGKEISLPYTGPGSSGQGKPLKSILHGNPDIPVMLGTATPLNIRMTAEIADGWMAMHLAPDSFKTRYKAIIEEGLARRSDGKALQDFEIRTSLSVQIVDDVKAALDALKPMVALYAGGMGSKSMNFHKDAMIERGFGAAAERVQELFLAGRKDEAAAAVPDEYIDDEGLLGPPARIKERWQAWRDSGVTSMCFLDATDEVVELMGRIGRD